MKISSATPVLLVDRVEPTRDFLDDVDAVMAALEGATIAVGRHRTFYGADEIERPS